MEKLNLLKDREANTDTLDKMKEAYLNCPAAIKYLNGIGINQEMALRNITKIYDFVCDFEYCSKCPGLKNCGKKNRCVCVKIVNNGGIIDRQLVPCKEYIKRSAFIKNYLKADFDEKWFDVDIKKLDKTAPRTKAIKALSSYIKGESNDWIYLVGGAGTGRTYFAVAMANYLNNQNKGPICFINSLKRFKELNDLNYKSNEEFEKIIELYSTIPTLVIDDFGNEVKNDVVRDGILLRILNARASKRLFTIFTSDFSIDEVVDLYSVSKSATPRAKQIGKIITSFVKEEINLGDISIY